MKIFSKNTWGVDINNAWPLTCKASCLKKIELRPLISGFDFAFVGGTESVRGFPTDLTVILSRNVTVKNIKRGTLFLAMINNNNIVFLLKRKLNSQAVKNKYNIQSILIGPMLIKPMTAK